MLFKFGAWVRVGYNASKVVAPLYIYVYSRQPIEIRSGNFSRVCEWGRCAVLGEAGQTEPIKFYVYIGGRRLSFIFYCVKSIEERAAKPPEAAVPLSKFKEWLDREAQASAVLALVAIIAAFFLKRATLLLSVTNPLNLALVLGVGAVIWFAAPRLGHSSFLALPFAISEVAAYHIVRVGRKFYLVKIVPSLKRLLMESAVLYRTSEGMLAYARQGVGEAFKRLMGRHIIIQDVESGKLGELDENKVWSIEDVTYGERVDGLVVVEARLTRERVLIEEEAEIYEE